MWWKLFLLTLYLTVLFVLSRILEAVAYYEGGYLSSRFLSPVSLSVRKLRAILDQRGVSYTPTVQHQQLTELVKSSGEVSDEEVEAATLALAEDAPASNDEDSRLCANLTCGTGTDFYDEMEEARDSVWVVQVVYGGWGFRINHTDWKYFIKKVSRFGIRTGYFDCTTDKRLCNKKRWYESQLILDMPSTQQTKDQSTQLSYIGPSDPHNLLSWVSKSLAARIPSIGSWSQLDSEWLRFDERRLSEEKIRVVLFSTLDVPPLFLSALSVRFSGRVKFGVVNVKKGGRGEELAERLRLKSDLPTYLVLTPEANYTFGTNRGEYLSYDSMSLLLRTLHPEVNDMFLLSLILINLACCLEFFITRGGLLKRFGRVLWDVVKWNFLLILLWLPVLGLFQLPFMINVFTHLLSLLRRISLTWFVVSLRSDWIWLNSGSNSVIVSFVIFSAVIGIAHYIYQRSHAARNDSTAPRNGNLWNFSWGSGNFLPTPEQLAENDGSQFSNIDMEMLIERLAVPNLWLGPLISSQYIQSLPQWRYTGPTIESDVGSDCESAASRSVESDGEEPVKIEGEVPSPPLMFICERCRAMQSIANKSQQELEQERLESESACAKYLMDGDYKCMCGGEGDATSGGSCKGHGGHHGDTSVRRRGSPRRRKTEAPVDNESGIMKPMPPGMIATMDCSICLESYKQSAILCGLPCGHSFHEHCILGWLKRDNHCCPICRWPAYKAKPCNKHQHCG